MRLGILLVLLFLLSGCTASTPYGETESQSKARRTGASAVDGSEGADKSAGSVEPDRMLLLVAGVLQWERPGLTSFDPTNRRDRGLHEMFVKERGVPEARTKLLLDEQATKSAILEGLRGLVAQSKSTDTVIFYFAGHGVRDASGQKVFLSNYDIDANKPDGSGIAIDDVAAAFDGAPERLGVVLLGDFCFSGALRDAADKLAKRGLRASSVTSADVSNVSTGSWTYTQTMIDVFRGLSIADRNGDGVITLGEAGAEVHDAMKFVEHQRSSFAGLNANLVLAKTAEGPKFGAAGSAGLAIGTFATLREGDDRVVRVRAFDGETTTVHHLRYADAEDLKVPAAGLSPIRFASFAAGSRVQVEWNGEAYPATVKGLTDDFHLITYTGFDSSWDEWVLSNRIVGSE